MIFVLLVYLFSEVQTNNIQYPKGYYPFQVTNFDDFTFSGIPSS